MIQRHISTPQYFPIALKKTAIALTGLAAPIVASLICFVAPQVSAPARAALKDSPKTVLDEAWQIVNREYVDDAFNQLDWEVVRHELLDREYTSQLQAYTALRDALARLGDPYTRFLDPREYQALTNQTAGEISGVGIRIERDGSDLNLRVVDVLEKSPARLEGIREGDRILKIDGRSTREMTVKEAAEAIRGDIGTHVTLTVRPDREGEVEGEIRDVRLKRARIELAAVDYALKSEAGQSVGYIRLKEFSSHAAEQMEKAIEDLQERGAEAFILDLRGNPGGLLEASVEIARMWLEYGAIVRTVDRYGRDEKLRADNTALTHLPLAVLVDGNSASASEILAGALQDNRRATIVGEQTFGKALVQSVYPLSDGSGLVVTIAHYYTPSGTDISYKGITPDVELGLSQWQLPGGTVLGSHLDPYYLRAVALLKAIAEDSSLANTDFR